MRQKTKNKKIETAKSCKKRKIVFYLKFTYISNRTKKKTLISYLLPITSNILLFLMEIAKFVSENPRPHGNDYIKWKRLTTSTTY